MANAAASASAALNQGIHSAHSILSNTPEPQSGRIRNNLRLSKLNLHSDPPTQWEVKKCKICQCWTYAYNPAINKFAVLLNNRINTSKLQQMGLLNHSSPESTDVNTQASSSEPFTSLEILRHQFKLVENEFVQRYSRSGGGVMNGGAAPPAAGLHTPGQHPSMFQQFRSDHQLSQTSLQNQLAFFHSEQHNQEKPSEVPEQGVVRVPVLKNLCVQLPC